MRQRSPVHAPLLRAASRAVAGVVVVVGLASAPACSTPLLETRVPTSEASLEAFRLGAIAYACHERSSDRFRLYLVCAGEKRALGVSDVHGTLAYTCPGLRIKQCRDFAEAVRAAGTMPGAEAAPVTPIVPLVPSAPLPDRAR